MKSRTITEENFLDLVKASEDGCWSLNLMKGDGRFGTYRFRNKKVRPAVIYWTLVRGRFPEYRLTRICDNRACVNPEHYAEDDSAFKRFIRKIKVEDGKRNPCWIWTGAKNRQGYGFLKDEAGSVPLNTMAHRFSYRYYVGEIPDGMVVMHSCDNPPCVNPAHLSVGTELQNSLDRDVRGRNKYRLNPDTVVEIRAKHSGGRSALSLSREYGIRAENIGKIVKRTAWSWVK